MFYMAVSISIIIPTKNEEKIIGKTLKKYLALKKKFNLEFIISDGNSTDKTAKIAKKYADRVVLAKKGQKQTIALGRNAGAKVARGKILFHTDADVFPKDPEVFFKEIQKSFEDESVLAVTTKLKIHPEEEVFMDKIGHFFINFFVKTFSSLGKGECQIVRKKTFDEVEGYNENLVMGEDSHLFHKISKLGKVQYLGHLSVYHSPRRFRKQGYIGVLSLFVFEGAHMVIMKKPFLKEWKQIR